MVKPLFKVVIDIAKSPHVVLDRDKAIQLLECIADKHGSTRDLEESMRYIENYEEFYNYLRRKFEDYLTPPKHPRDAILGRVIVHKLRLFKEDEREMVELLFDRRFNLDILENCLKQVINDEVVFEKQFF